MKQTFKKEERLTNKKTFDELFNSRNSISVSPFKILWSEKQGVNQTQVGIAVPKKSFAKAVQRNKLKRRIREAYRKNKHLLYAFLEKKNHPIALVIIYTEREELSYQQIEQKMVVSLQKLIDKMQ